MTDLNQDSIIGDKKKTIDFQYAFKFSDGSEEIFKLKIDAQNLELIENIPKVLPSWTNLYFHQCPNCTLLEKNHPHCPLAANLVNIVKKFEPFLSYNEINMNVITEERVISQNTTVQRGVSSLLGLVFATSGCSHLAFFKPMARFHLPLANEEETVYRATSMYLLAQYFLKKKGEIIDYELNGLTKIYNNVKILNSSVAQRLRVASKTDSTLNAIVLLDVYAHTIPHVIESYMEEIRYLFTPFLSKESDSIK